MPLTTLFGLLRQRADLGLLLPKSDQSSANVGKFPAIHNRAASMAPHLFTLFIPNAGRSV